MTGFLRTLAIGTALALAHAGAAGAQSAAPGAPPPAAANRPAAATTGTAGIRGHVVAGDTNRPLRGARVTVTSPALGRTGKSATTTADGRYELQGLAPGRYTVSVSKSGYLTLQYGQRRPLEQGIPLQLDDRQLLDPIDFALPRMGVITGRVTDELGDPIEGVVVFPMRLQFWQGRRQWVPSGSLATTDDAGQYRIINLTPATYTVMANSNETWTATKDGREDTLSYAQTFFPGTADVAVARAITVGVGRETGAIDFSLVPGRTVTVSGTLFDSRGAPLIGTNVALIPQGTLGPGGGIASIGGGANSVAGGQFTIRNVKPGSYIMQAASSTESGMRPLTVTDNDVTDLSLMLSTGGSVTGTITTESGAPPGVPRDRVSLSAGPVVYSGMGMSGGPQPRQIINDDWTFTLSGVVGPSRLRAVLPDGWVVKAIVAEDRDITEDTIELKSQEELSKVRVILSDRVSSVSGQLLDARGAASLNGTVVLFSDDPRKWVDNSRYVRGGRPDQQGRYEIKGLPAGDYLAIALDEVEQGIWNDAAWLESIRRLAQRFTLGDGESKTLALKLILP